VGEWSEEQVGRDGMGETSREECRMRDACAGQSGLDVWDIPIKETTILATIPDDTTVNMICDYIPLLEVHNYTENIFSHYP
jgi:hypothetical protein